VSEASIQQIYFRDAGLRFAEFCTTFAEEYKSNNEKLEEDLPNLFSALDIFRSHYAWSAVAKLIYSLDNFLDGGGYLDHLRYWLEHVYKNADMVEDKAILTSDFLSLAHLYAMQGMRNESIEIYELAIRMADTRKDITSLAKAYYGFGTIFSGIGEIERAKQYWKTALYYANQANEGIQVAIIKYNLALLEKSRKEETQFIHQIHQVTQGVIQTFTGLGQEGVVAKNLLQASTFLQTGRLNEAKSLFHEVLEVYEKGYEKQGQALVLYNLGLIAQGEGDPNSALEYYRKSLGIAQELQDRTGLILLHSSIGMAYLQSDRYGLARPFLEQCVSLLREDGDQERLADALYWLGYSLANTESLQDAESAFVESRTIFLNRDPRRVEDVDEVLAKLREVFQKQKP